MTKRQLIAKAKSLAKSGDWVEGRTVTKICKSSKYTPGDLVHPEGYGWGAVNNWHKDFYFIASYRIKGNGIYALLNTKGNVTTLTNIRKDGEKRFYGQSD